MNAREQNPHVRPGVDVVVRERGVNNVERSYTIVVEDVQARGFSGWVKGRKKQHGDANWYRWNQLVSVPDAPRPPRVTLAERKDLADRPVVAVATPVLTQDARVAIERKAAGMTAGEFDRRFPPHDVKLATPIQLAPRTGARFSTWLSGWLDGGVGRASKLANGVKVHANVVTMWRHAKRAPTERDVVELAAYFDRLGLPDDPPEADDWLEAVEAMVARDVAAGVRLPAGSGGRPKLQRAKAPPQRPQEPVPEPTPAVLPPAPPPAPAPAQAAQVDRFERGRQRLERRRALIPRLLGVLDGVDPDEAMELLVEAAERLGEVPRG